MNHTPNAFITARVPQTDTTNFSTHAYTTSVMKARTTLKKNIQNLTAIIWELIVFAVISRMLGALVSTNREATALIIFTGHTYGNYLLVILAIRRCGFVTPTRHSFRPKQYSTPLSPVKQSDTICRPPAAMFGSMTIVGLALFDNLMDRGPGRAFNLFTAYRI